SGIGGGCDALLGLALESLPLPASSRFGVLRGLGGALLSRGGALLSLRATLAGFLQKALRLGHSALGGLRLPFGFACPRLHLAQASLELVDLRRGLFPHALQVLLQGVYLVHRPVLGDLGGLGRGGADPLLHVTRAHLAARF